MAFKFTKEDLARRDEYVTNLRAEWRRVDKAVEAYNAAMSENKAELEKLIGHYNNELGEASGWMEDVCSRLSAEYDEKSEKWQESERGEAVRSWIDELEGLDLEWEVSPDLPEELQLDEPEHADTLDQIEVEVQS